MPSIRSWSIACGTVLIVAASAPAADPLRVAGVTTVYYHNSHADVILGRLVEGQLLNGQGDFPQLKLSSLFVDQFPDNDKSRKLSTLHKFFLSKSIREALTLSDDRTAVDGVLLVAEHGKYPESDTGSIQFPKRRMFAEIAAVCEATGKPVPVFVDKHLADKWDDAKWIYDEARRLKFR